MTEWASTPYLETATPHPLLRAHIRAFVQRDFDMGRGILSEPVVARLGTMLEFQFEEPYRIPSIKDGSERRIFPITIIGPITERRVQLLIRGKVSALAVLFQPSGFHRMFRTPTAPLAEGGTDGHSVLGPRISSLYERMGNAQTFQERVALLNRYFLNQLCGEVPDLSLDLAFRRLRAHGSENSIEGAARLAGLSTRQFERKALEVLGVSPRTVRRVARFQWALARGLAGRETLLEIAHAAGYHDQMHMVRDFRSLAGDAPTKSLLTIAPHHLIRF